jgi:cytochrome oxidase Cu insertion factor (SCO1/SenC/PrrC family)
MATRRLNKAFGCWRVGLVALGLLTTLAGSGCRQEPQLATFGPAPSFALTDQSGSRFSSADLGGRVALANFIYTSCTDTCPLLSATMGQVQEQLKAEGLFGSKVALLSFSLDPDRDTPPALMAYGERFGVDRSGWKMLTGETELLAQIADDFKLGRPILLPPSPQNPAITLGHSNRFVLIDREGQVRAYYRGEELDVQEVLRDLRRLAR